MPRDGSWCSGPAGTPQPIVERLHNDLKAIMGLADVQQAGQPDRRRAGGEPAAGGLAEVHSSSPRRNAGAMSWRRPDLPDAVWRSGLVSPALVKRATLLNRPDDAGEQKKSGGEGMQCVLRASVVALNRRRVRACKFRGPMPTTILAADHLDPASLGWLAGAMDITWRRAAGSSRSSSRRLGSTDQSLRPHRAAATVIATSDRHGERHRLTATHAVHGALPARWTTNATLYKKLPYDPAKGFVTPIALTSTVAFVLSPGGPSIAAGSLVGQGTDGVHQRSVPGSSPSARPASARRRICPGLLRS